MLPDPETKVSALALKRRLVDRDWQEAITFSFVSSGWEAALFPDRDANDQPIAVLNPIASHLDVMRTTLLGGLIDVLRTNLSRRQERVRVFEVGRCFLRAGQGYDQPLRIGGLAYGYALPEQWGAPKRLVDVFDVKGDLEALMHPRIIVTEQDRHPALHPGRAGRVLVDGAAIGWIGEVHPRLVQHFELPRAADCVRARSGSHCWCGRYLARRRSQSFPWSVAILAVVVDETVPAQDIVAALEAVRRPHVDSIRLFDVYRGHGIEAERKALRFWCLCRILNVL
jgi:phenylalanyl-tRNA synthetase beta chain